MPLFIYLRWTYPFNFFKFYFKLLALLILSSNKILLTIELLNQFNIFNDYFVKYSIIFNFSIEICITGLLLSSIILLFFIYRLFLSVWFWKMHLLNKNSMLYLFVDVRKTLCKRDTENDFLYLLLIIISSMYCEQAKWPFRQIMRGCLLLLLCSK